MITGLWKLEAPIEMIGLSGRKYVSNPMGVKQYGFTTYENGKWIGVTPEDVAYQDAKDVPTVYETWEITTPEGTERIRCTEDGAMEAGTIQDYCKSIINQYGFDAVNIIKCSTTN